MVEDERLLLALEESRREFDSQVTSFRGLQARATALLTAASVGTSFLGSAVSREDGGVEWLTILGLVGFVVVFAAAIAVLVPRWIHRGIRAEALVDGWIGEKDLSYDDTVKLIVHTNTEGMASNDATMVRLARLFFVGAAGLAVNIGALLLDVLTRA